MEYISHIEGRKGLPSEVKRRQKVAFVMVSEISWEVPRADSGRPGLGATQAPALVPALCQGSWGLRRLGPRVVGPRGLIVHTDAGPRGFPDERSLSSCHGPGCVFCLMFGKEGAQDR